MMNEPNSILGSFQTGNNETNVNSLVPEESGSEIYSSSLVGESLPEEDELEITARLLEEESYLETNLEQDTISLLGNSQDNDLYLRTNVDQELEYSYDGITFWGDINGETSELEPYQLSDNSQIIVDLKEGLDRLFVDQSLSEDLANFGATLTFYGGEGSDSLMGTQLNSLWEIEGENSGNLNQYILFEDLENLIGEEDNQDTFILKEGASLSGVLDGGEGGYDVLEIEGTTYESVTYTAFDAHSGTVNLDGNLIEFAGLEPVTIDGDADDMTIDLSSLDGVSSSDDQATLLNAATDGQITLRSDNSTFEHTTFNNPTNSLTIKLGGGDDSLTVESLDDAFSADLIISGDDNNLLNLDDPGDSVTFVSDLYLNGGNLEVTAETITVNDGVTISTRQVASDHVSGDSTGDSGYIYFIGDNPISVDGALFSSQPVETIDIGDNTQLLSHVQADSDFAAADIWLNARYFSNASVLNLAPVLYNPLTTKIDIGENALFKGNNIIIKAQAEDKSFSELTGADETTSDFIIEPLEARIGEAVALPVKVLVNKATASVTVNTGVILEGLAGVSVEAVATAAPSGNAAGQLVSIGYTHAEADATVDILGTASITAGEAVKIGSEGSATSSITTETEGTNDSSAGFSFAVDYAKIKSHTTVETDVIITAGKTANIVALGNKETEANATSKTGQSGLISLGFGVNISETDIKADVDGTVTANQNPGAIVKLELNPLKEVAYEFDPTQGSIIDTTNNTLTLSNDSHSLRTGDKITYSQNSGSAIGGLSDEQDYYVVIDPDNLDLIRFTDSREDAFDVATALETGDTSTVNSKTVDLTGVGSLGSNTIAASGVDNTEDTLSLNTSEALEIGQAVVYDNGGNADITGLVDGQTYYVITYSYDEDTQQQIIQLGSSESDAKAGVAIDIDASSSSGNHSLQRLQKLTAAVIDVDTNTIDLAKVFNITDADVTPHALATGDQVSYANRRGTSIGGFDQFGIGEDVGLVDGQDYYIVTDPNNANVIRLATSEIQALEAYQELESDPFADISDLVVDINNGVNSGGEDVVAAVNVKEFDPTELGIVDDTDNSIILDNEAFTGSDFFGSDADFSLLGSTFELGQAVIYNSNGGKPIGGLSDGTMYYIGTAVDENNLEGDNRFVSKQLIQLAETENKARAGVFLDIDPSVATGNAHSLTATHVIDSGLATGIGVLAQLSSSDKAVGVSEMKDDITDTSGSASFDIFEAAGKIFSGLVNNSNNGDYNNKSNAGGNNEGGSDLSLGGALGFIYTDHDVLANVGSNAVLKSAEDLEVQGTIAHQIQLNADSDVETSGDNAGSAAVVVGVFNDDADAIVNSNAQLDAYRATRVIADVSYPYLTRPDEFVPANLGELVDLVKTEGYDTINNYMDGTLGLKSTLINTWARSTASADNVGASGSVNVLIFNNDSNALVKSDAQINQDLDWRANSENQTVSVEATTSMQMINLTGVFQFSLPTLEIAFANGEASTGDIKLLGSDGKTGIGGAFFLMSLDNNTKALVEDGVDIYNGSLGGFNMKAREAIMNFNFTQAGSKGTKYGIAGTFGYVDHDSDTIARLAGGTNVEGRSATIFAGSLGTHINWTGSVAKGGNLGFGITVAINDLNRNTFAVIGDFDDDNLELAALPSELTTINVTDGVKVDALSDGWMGAFSVAAAVADGNPATTTTTQTGDTEDAGDAADQTIQPTSGIGLSGDVSYNKIEDTVNAVIYDAGLLEANKVELDALNETEFYAVAGAVAFAKAAPGKTSFGLAGAASWNEVIGDTQAYIDGQGNSKKLELNAEELQLDAQQTGSIFAITAGGSGAFGGETNVALAGSFSYNNIDNTTASYVDGVDATLTGVSGIAPVVIDSSNIDSDESVADTITFEDTHGWATGTAVKYDNGGETDIGGLTHGNTYYVVADERNGKILQLAQNSDGTSIIDLDPSTTTGEHRLYEATTLTTTEIITFDTEHGWSDGDLVTYVSDGDAVGGLEDGAEYYVVLDGDTDDFSIKLSDSEGGAALTLDFSEATGDKHSVYQTADDDDSYELFDFDPSVDNSFDISQVEAINTITLSSPHNFVTGQAVVYENGGGESIGGLTQGETYYVIADDSDANAFRLATSEVQAKLEFALTLDPSLMSGDNHQFLPQSNVVKAKDKSNIFAVAGTATLSLGSGAKTGGGIGFGFGWNEIENSTKAYIKDSSLSYDDSLQVLANNNSTIQAISASVGVSSAQKTAGTIAGTASVNFIDNITEAYLDNVNIGSDGDSSGLLRVVAQDSATIQSLSGAISVAISSKMSLGFGGAVAYNAIGTKSGHGTSAYINNSSLYVDSLDVTATGGQTIQSLSGALAAAKSGKAAITAAGAVSINRIKDTATNAYISNSPTVSVDNAVTIQANNTATIESLAGQVAISIGSKGAGALGASVAINEIDKTGDGQSVGVYA
ncbi:beta strand repeat-containing protein, partial [Crocosphaera watsonii]